MSSFASAIDKENDVMRALGTVKRLFFVGIGGVSMSSLAAVAKKAGYDVAGSDRSRSETTEKLERDGIKVFYSHSSDNICGYEAVIYTAAVSPSNPELVRAAELGLLVFSRAEFLGALMLKYRNRIGVAGTHGKTTTTTMLTEIFSAASRRPTVINGAVMRGCDSAYILGDDNDFIFEACEYKDSFLSFSPTVAVITNIELDHVDYFSDITQFRGSFERYISYADTAVMNFDDAQSLIAAEHCGDACHRIVSYAIDNGEAEYRAENITCEAGVTSFELMHRSDRLCTVSLGAPGRHNVMDALASAAAAHLCGVAPEDIAAGLASFHGAKRRFEFLGRLNGADVYEDYAHHPSEMRATLAAARSLSKRVICVFQPHTYSRTAALGDEMAKALEAADIAVLADIYAARETNTFGISSRMLAEKISGARYFDSFEAIADYISGECGDGDIIIIMGAGDISRLGTMLGLA